MMLNRSIKQAYQVNHYSGLQHPALVRRSSRSLQARSISRQSNAVAAEVLAWVQGPQHGSSNDLLAVADLPAPRMRGLVALRDIQPNQLLLSVPFQKIYMSAPEHELELHWAAEMAARLLGHMAECKQANKQGHWCRWIASLPQHVSTPLEWGPEALAAVGDPVLQAEVAQMQECLRASHEVLKPQLAALGAGYQEFLGAVQLLHSRCFFLQTQQEGYGCHVAVPGVDLANHSATPTAYVEVRHNPAAVQGLAALEDIADPATLAPEPSTLRLLAGAQGIRGGEEVTISYGPWPDAAFCLLFGFLPEDNPHNSVVLFKDVHDLARTLAAMLYTDAANEGADVNQAAAAQPQLHQALDRLDKVWQEAQASTAAMGEADDEEAGAAAPQPGDMARLVVTADGWDQRMQPALDKAYDLVQAALRAYGSTSAEKPAPTAQQVLLFAIQERLNNLSAASARQADVSHVSSGMSLALAYRERQFHLLSLCHSKLLNSPSGLQ